MSPDPAAAVAATTPPELTPGVLLDRSRPCARCAYDLFRQPLDGRCPECGTDVAASLRARYLRDAGPGYLRSLRHGANLIVALVAVALVGLGAELAGMYVTALSPSWRTSMLFQALLDVGFLAATWLLTAADPGRPRPLARWAARAVVLSLAVVQAVVTGCVIAYGVEPSSGMSLPDLRRLWAALVTTTAFEAASTLAFGFTVAGLSDRLPAPGLARGVRAASVGLFLALLAALTNFAMFLAWMHDRLAYETASRLSRLLVWPENIGRVVSGVAAAALLWLFTRRLRAEIAEGAQGHA